MPVGGFTVGRDVTIDFSGPTGIVRFNLITGFTAKPDVIDQKVKGLDGIVRHVVFHDGWTGSLDLERQDSTLDDYWAQLEANYYQGINNQYLTITETITEVAGNITQYRFENVLIKLEDAGDWKGDATVKQKFSFLASRRRKVV